MRRLAIALVAVVVIVALCAACGSSRPGRSTARPGAWIAVDNQSFLDMNIYLINGGTRMRLGFAIGKRESVFPIPGRYLGGARDVQFQADAIGSNQGTRSQSIWVSPGDTVFMIIPP